MPDVDINAIRPQADAGLDRPKGARGVAGWRQEIRHTRELLTEPYDEQVNKRIQEGQRLSQPGTRGVI